jgi:iron complex transport system permease protein
MDVRRARATVEAVVRPESSARPSPSRLSGRWLGAGLGAVAGAVLLGCALGPAGLPVRAVMAELVSLVPGVDVGPQLTDREAAILWQIRMPRVVLGALVGAMLAVAGAAYQGVFRNPLADPYLLGVAAGAGLGATVIIAYGPSTSGWPVDPLPLFAFCGACLAVAASWLVGRTGGAARDVASLLLAGIAVAAFLTAAQTYIQQREIEELREVYSWLLGGLSTSGWHEVRLILPYVLVGTVTVLLHRRLLDVLSVGDDEAGALGVDTGRVRLIVVGTATLGTAAAVAVTGLIGFVGIIVPHAVRLVAGTSYRVVVPLSLMFGAAFLVLADIAARTLVSPAELPIGVITAFVGAPFFAVVLHTSRRSRR